MTQWCIQCTTKSGSTLPDSKKSLRRQSPLFDPARPLTGRLPPLVMLRAFEATGRTGSMRKASFDIGVSHTVVSRHVQNLESWIGCKLLLASPRGIVLTTEGEALYKSTTEAFQTIANVSAQLRQEASVDDLQIWCVPGLATRWLIPRLEDMKAAISSGEVLLRAMDRNSGAVAGEVDLMIGFCPADQLPEHAVPLLEPRMFPVASPAWLARHGAPASIEDLIHLPLIHEQSYAQWTNWFKQAGLQLTLGLGGPRLWDASLGFDAALSGQGVALTSSLIASDEVKKGKLIELFETDIRVGGYYLLKSDTNGSDERIERLELWIKDNFLKHEKHSRL